MANHANSPLDFNMFLTDMNSPPVPDLSAMFAGSGSGSNDRGGQAQEPQPSPFGGMRSGATTPFLGIDDPSAYGLDPSTFASNVSFAMPSFVSAGGPFVGDGAGQGPAYMEVPSMAPSYTLPQPQMRAPSQQSGSFGQSRSGFSSKFKGGSIDLGPHNNYSSQPPTSAPYSRQQPRPQQPQQPSGSGQINSNAGNPYAPNPNNPVYSGYGSSFVSVIPDKKPFATMPPLPVPYRNPYKPTTGRESPGFDSKAPGMPQAIGGNFPGLYSSSGFDMLGVLARVAARPNPQINIGPVDTSASFLVVDARRFDFPIVSASQTFSVLTGYALHEIIGRNCRFLQSPTGDVVQGSKRKYTDANAAYHMKTHILSGKECQASVINYRKDGTPFINLITIIPITWDTDEISYFVGFQVDLVEQPNAILEKMKDGTYVVNYSLLPNQPYANGPNGPAQVPTQSAHRQALEAAVQDAAHRSGVPGNFGNAAPSQFQLSTSQPAPPPAAAAIEPKPVAQAPVEAAAEPVEAPFGDEEDATRRAWYKLVLENSGDFIHVLSLKGSFLYVSPMAAKSLEYETSELVGKTIQAICHPSDIVPVMRELKDSGSGNGHQVVNLLYRIRRKHSGYVWIEAQGKLHIEQGKGRKCVILLGRQRSVYSISWSALGRAGGLGDHEFWGKVSLDGMWLYATSKASNLLGRLPRELVGTSVIDLLPAAQQSQYTAALATAAAGTATSLRHDMLNRRGEPVTFVTTFHASTSDSGTAQSAQAPWLVVQVNTAGSEDRRRRNQPAPVMPPNRRSRSSTSMVSVVSGDGDGDGHNSDSSGAPSTYSAVPSTFKTLSGHPSLISDNMFDELDTTRSTSWQFELHQLQLTNKKLREERDLLQSVRRKRQRRNEEAGPSRSGKSGRVCANCGRTDSPEWRSGPTGKASLCNACGLRWQKSMSKSGSAPPTPSDDSPSSSYMPQPSPALPQLAEPQMQM